MTFNLQGKSVQIQVPRKMVVVLEVCFLKELKFVSLVMMGMNWTVSVRSNVFVSVCHAALYAGMALHQPAAK